MKRHTLRVSKRRHLWRDPRFLSGVALIALSVLTCTWLVASARDGEALYCTTRAVAPGEALDETNTQIVAARVPSHAYVHEGAMPDGALAAHALDAGELVPTSAVTNAQNPELRNLVITVNEALPASTQAGDLLELWAIPVRSDSAEGNDVASGSQRIAQSVTLVRVIAQPSMLSDTCRIEILITAQDLPHVLDAMSGGGAIAAVPIGAPDV